MKGSPAALAARVKQRLSLHMRSALVGELQWGQDTVVGDFQVLAELGAGGMGRAFKAFDRRLKRTVALKTLHESVAGSPESQRRLLREARAAAALSHPNICTIYAIAEDRGVPFIVMEYVQGRTLADVIRDGPMDPLTIIALALQVADALDAAHRLGIVHRDIKPANIMLSDDGQVKVLDFGLAAPVLPGMQAILQLTSASGISAFDSGAGTLGYTSPEALDGDTIDGRADLFAFGVVLYELSTGRHPFVGPTPMATVARVLTAKVESIRLANPAFPQQLDEVILRCLVKERNDRYPSAAAVRSELSPQSNRGLWRRRVGQETPSIAVLPFVSLSDSGTDEYLADGFTNELTSKMAQGSALLVIARTSAMRYKHSTKDARLIGQELGVRALVEGAVRVHRSGCTLTANLIDVATGFQTWAGAYETSVDDVFSATGNIADQVFRVLHVDERSGSRNGSAPREDRQALEIYLRALQAYHTFTASGNTVAIDLLHRLVDREPSYARAHALIASACLARIERGWESDPGRWLHRALEASATALRFDPGISEAYSARGLISFFSKRNEEAEADAREALRVDNNNDIAHNLLGRVRFARGEFRGAISSYRDALDINPYYVWCLNDLAWALLLVGDEATSEQTLDRVLSLSPSDEGGWCGKAAFSYMRGDAAGAAEAISKARSSNSGYPWVLQLLPLIMAGAGKVAEAREFCAAVIAQGDAAYFGHASLALVCGDSGDTQSRDDHLAAAMQLEPFYAANNLSYASLSERHGQRAAAEQWLRKAVREGVRLVEVDAWHPTLRQLAVSAGIIHSRSDNV